MIHPDHNWRACSISHESSLSVEPSKHPTYPSENVLFSLSPSHLRQVRPQVILQQGEAKMSAGGT
jgi:hypothetical protein